jgi:hypothetical protein
MIFFSLHCFPIPAAWEQAVLILSLRSGPARNTLVHILQVAVGCQVGRPFKEYSIGRERPLLNPGGLLASTQSRVIYPGERPSYSEMTRHSSHLGLGR